MEQPNSEPQRKRLSFDPTINLGHVLTGIMMLGAGFGAYSTLDRRLAVQEEKTSAIVLRQQEQQAQVKDSLQEIKSDVKDVQRSVNDVNRALSRRP
jgi:hypothetical protein